MTSAIAFSLIVITTAGQVTYSSGYENLHMCMEARSLALTGLTVEAKADKDAAKVAQAVAERAIDVEGRQKRMAADMHRKPVFTCYAEAVCDNYKAPNGDQVRFDPSGAYVWLSGNSFISPIYVVSEHDGTRNVYVDENGSVAQTFGAGKPGAFWSSLYLDPITTNIKTAECVARSGS